MVPCTIKFSLTDYCETVNKGWLRLVLLFAPVVSLLEHRTRYHERGIFYVFSISITISLLSNTNHPSQNSSSRVLSKAVHIAMHRFIVGL